MGTGELPDLADPAETRHGAWCTTPGTLAPEVRMTVVLNKLPQNTFSCYKGPCRHDPTCWALHAVFFEILLFLILAILDFQILPGVLKAPLAGRRAQGVVPPGVLKLLKKIGQT